MTQRVRNFIGNLLDRLQFLLQKKKQPQKQAKEHKQFILQLIQTVLSQESYEKANSPDILLELMLPALEVLKAVEDIDLENSVLNESKYIFKAAFFGGFTVADIDRFVKLVGEYLYSSELSLPERKRLFKFKCFAQ